MTIECWKRLAINFNRLIVSSNIANDPEERVMLREMLFDYLDSDTDGEEEGTEDHIDTIQEPINEKEFDYTESSHFRKDMEDCISKAENECLGSS